MKTEDLVQLAVFGALAYFLYNWLNKGATAIGKGIGNAAGFVIADFYTWAVLSRQNMNLQGNILLPDGSTIPLQDVDIRQSPQGVVVALVNGAPYQLYASNENGDWPAVPL